MDRLSSLSTVNENTTLCPFAVLVLVGNGRAETRLVVMADGYCSSCDNLVAVLPSFEMW